MNYLPSKQFIITLMSVIAIIGIIAIVSNIDKSKLKTKKNTDKRTYTSPVLKSLTEKDSDNDGLKDWEEALWKTDVNNSDTDGDGTTDGEEVKIGRNPAIAGPNDLFTEKELKKRNVFSRNSKNGTETDALSREFFSTIIALGQTGKLDKKTITEVSNSFVEKLVNSKPEQTYRINELNTTTTNSDNKLLIKYGNELGTIIQSYPQKNIAEFEIITDALKTKNYGELKNLDTIILYYNKTSKTLLNMKVPQELALSHLDALNGVSKIIIALKDIQNISKDPVKAIMGISQYQKGILEINKSVKSTQNYFIKKNIFFGSNEPGRLFSI